MLINFSLNETQVYKIMLESEMFRAIMIAQLISQQNDFDKLKGAYPSEATALENLEDYIVRNFSFKSKIEAIQYVRRWAVDNKTIISPVTYDALYSLAKAKQWVEARLNQ